MLTETTILDALRTVQDPELRRDIVSLDMVKDVHIDGTSVALKVDLTTPACPLKDEIGADIQARLGGIGATDVDAHLGRHRCAGPHPSQPENLVPGVKNIIAVASGKGGVGKSSVSVNLAVALAMEGASVGLLDADITGPNIPQMMGLEGAPTAAPSGKILPLERYGVKVISIQFFVPEGQPIVWRGPLVGGAIQQFLRDVDWGELDYLVVDLPPGTSDAQLTLAQSVPVSGALLVTTPQDVALADVEKALAMFRRLSVPILGLVENMSAFICPHCGEATEIFGRGGGERFARAPRAALLRRHPAGRQGAPGRRRGRARGRPAGARPGGPGHARRGPPGRRPHDRPRRLRTACPDHLLALASGRSGPRQAWRPGQQRLISRASVAQASPQLGRAGIGGAATSDLATAEDDVAGTLDRDPRCPGRPRRACRRPTRGPRPPRRSPRRSSRGPASPGPAGSRSAHGCRAGPRTSARTRNGADPRSWAR